MPLAVRRPARLPAGRVVEAFVSHTDLAPTFLDAAGLRPPGSMTGRSLLPLLRGEALTGRDRVFVERERHANVRTGDLSYPMRVTSVNATWGRSAYHAFITKVDKRARGMNFMASYSFSRLEDDVSGPFSGEALGAAGVQNWYDLAAERSRSALDAPPHRLVFSYILELPVGDGHRALSGGWLGKALGGWQVNGITSFQSGVPLGAGTSTNTTFSFGGGQRPHLLRDPRLPASERSVERWFDTLENVTEGAP